ncbi:hypothetical protein [Legionella hackeliae]|uniref:Sugar 3,4-ketoisomerase QdtA cupin domain-containing protein n=1 Tax=Legionella hackeliae TaxID=449 RepID=A0A0A8UXJ4_LEGHA|nr:hypothetical protein [Legionella hackeliae]KTD15168.1 hypothetical protein Lhac_0010 [Legionella hackeliae]CEK11469.1 protein of unknown function [Legionella hackeliae]STX48239.1 Uncharacterised protein [Legionella hackeliae]
MKDELVEIREFKSIGDDERGVTQEFSIGKNQSEFLCITRKKDTISGNNYHLGIENSLSPKRFVLLTGCIELVYRQVDSHQKHSKVLKAPCIIAIKPKVIHAVKAITDILLLECNSLADIQKDNFKVLV